MSWRRVRVIYRKDMRDALRDSRVLTALIVPLLIGLLYSFMFPDETPTQRVKVGVVSEGTTALTAAISRTASSSVRLTFVTVPAAGELERRIREEELDIGLVVPPSFDADVQAGRSPALTAVLPSSPSFGGDYVAALLDRSVQTMAERAPPARIELRSLPPEPGSGQTVLEVLGVRTEFILISLILVLAMIAVYAVPAVLTDEVEKRTMDALTLIASTFDVIAAKALFGITYCLISVPLMLVVTRGRPADAALLAIAVGLSSVVLVGLGLLFAGLFKTQQQINTWSGLLLLPLLAPAFTVGMPTPDAVNTALWLIPTVHTFRLSANAFAGATLYPVEWLSYAVLVAWGAAAYGLLWWRLSRQEEA